MLDLNDCLVVGGLVVTVAALWALDARLAVALLGLVAVVIGVRRANA